MDTRRLSHRPWVKALAWNLITAIAATSSSPALAALTDLSDSPLGTGVTTQVKPNLLFILDDSGSMDSEYMPDGLSGWTSYVGIRNYQCNSIYYNPNTTYSAPLTATGGNLGDQSFTSAESNGYDTSGSNVNLSSSFRAFVNVGSGGGGGTSDTSQAAYYYKFTGTGTPTESQCKTNASSSYPHNPTNWTKVRVSSTSGPGSTDERTNFANWYSYYRTRLLMMKAATGRAFSNIGSSYRVGFITINPGDPVSSDKYLAISDFNATQKGNWYSKLYAQTAGSSTPLRVALSRAGRHFAGKTDGINDGMSGDPVQYSCQQNFALLTTDGYWNGGAGVQLDGSSAIGNQDGTLGGWSQRPMFDGSLSTVTTNVSTVVEAYSTSGCSFSRKKIVATTTVNSTSIGSDGTTSTDSNSSSSTVVKCSSNPRSLAATTITTTVETSSSGGSSDSLSDVAQYYYITDLRGAGSIGALGLDVGTQNNVPSAGTSVEADSATHQHMTTFTMGLGISGDLAYRSDYLTATTGDFAGIRTGSVNWPTPSSNDATALDDLWHAAVNGRGQFFSASDPDSVVSSLQAALAGVNARVGAAAAAATSNLEPVSGDNYAYTASYQTVNWTGDLQAKVIDLTSGAVSTTATWSAQAKLDLMVGEACDNRTIKLFRSGATSNLVNFAWNSYACDSAYAQTGSAVTGLNSTEQAYFDSGEIALLEQYSQMTDGTGGTVNQRSNAAGAALVNFLRGQRGNESFEVNSTQYFRERAHILGDIANAQPVYVKAPFASYTDTGYASFQSANASRTPMVYAAANDGMLHAFYAGTSDSDTLAGKERWAFIPTMVLPNLYKLASTTYSNNHQFLVDGTPTVGDVYDSTASAWKTILVGGLNKGGQGYYALDVTDPGNPKGLWEFKRSSTCYPTATASDCHLGYSYGNPIISKLADGRWVVFVTSGYNNVNSPAITGDGIGYLYVLNAITGAIIYKISTGYGDSTTPAGLGKINNYVYDTATNNSTTYVYGVDLAGNIWRFTVNGSQSAQLIGVVKDSSGNRQSITTKPLLADVGSPSSTYIYVGTGRYIGATDVDSTATQSIWGIKDTVTTTAIADLRASLKKMAYTTSGNSRTIACSTGCTNSGGWFVDLPITGERLNIDMKLELGTLIAQTNIPENSACNIGGYSWINFFDASAGTKVAGATSAGSKLSDSLAVGLNLARLTDGRVVAISTTSDSRTTTGDTPVNVNAPTGRRVTWREVVN